MKIKDIHDEDDKFPISSIEKAEIVKIGQVKDGNNGQYQIINIMSTESNISVMLYNENHFLDPAIDKGKMVEFKSGPPHNGKPTGLIVKVGTDGKRKVSVTGKAIMKLGSATQEEKPQLTDIMPSSKEMDDGYEAAFREKEFSKDGEAAYNLPEEFIDPCELKPFEPGPNDKFIAEFLEERIHIWNVLQVNAPQDLHFEFSDPWITGIHIEMGKQNKKILPINKPKPKEKFNEIEKPHNPDRPKQAPVDKADDAAASETSAEMMVRFLNNTKDILPCLKFKTNKGNALFAVMSNPDTRFKSMNWYLARKAQGSDEESKLFDAIDDLFRELPANLKTFVVYESIYFNQVELGNIKHNPNDMDITEVHQEYMSDIISKFIREIPTKELWKVYKPYFKSKVENRNIS